MRPVLHSGLVTAKKRRRDALGKGKVPKLARACERGTHDLDCFGVAMVRMIRLKIVLRRIGGIRNTALHKPQLAAECLQPRNLRRAQKIFEFEKHLPSSPAENSDARA